MKIRLAQYSERNLILDFIRENWQKDHIFVRWPKLFDDYHRNGDKLNYMIAIDETEGKIYGVCGFIYANHKKCPDVWLALWKVIPSGIPSLGMDLVNSIQKNLHCNVLACCGIRKEVKKLYEFMGYKTGTMRHFYRLNRNCSYKIAVVNDDKIPDVVFSTGTQLIEIPSEHAFMSMVPYEKEIFQNAVPLKDKDYIIRKYFHNIAYTYRLYAIKTVRESIDAVLIARIVEANGGKALRIVDFLGDETALQKCGAELDRIMVENACEYTDIYEFGLADSVLYELGMKESNEEDSNIIPNYFEPFEPKNVDIHFFTNQLDNFRMFKADGDQERPNFIYGMEETNEKARSSDVSLCTRSKK